MNAVKRPKRYNTKPSTNNSNATAKVLLRRELIRSLRSLNIPVHVIDFYCGRYVMRDKAYDGYVDSYEGIDKVYGVDNAKWAEGSDLSPYTLLDFDAYGSPLKELMPIVMPKKKPPYGIAWTDGSMMGVQLQRRMHPFIVDLADSVGVTGIDRERRSSHYYKRYPSYVAQIIAKMAGINGGTMTNLRIHKKSAMTYYATAIIT